MSNKTRITWLGHSTVLLQTAHGTNLLIDPFLTGNPSAPKNLLLPEKLDAILLTHAHNDHIGDALPLAQKYGATIVAIHELAVYMAGKGAEQTIGMNLGGSVVLGDVTATMVEAKHSSSIQDENGVQDGGVAAGFVLTIKDGITFYHAGDTNVFGDMKLIGDLYHPQVALLPIGGHYTMGPREAALAVRLLSPQTVLPIHFGTFPPLTGRPAELAALVDPTVKVVDWHPGDVFEA
ncbi:metal-dependent hydrolase [Telmatobacter bradus]|uniref:metal-dependent hydrolase n=1 Tax=Telmatobacter bradus TaxID=474953 RepID=UPI003B4279BC